jgi:anti-sigma B factor antagonist
LTIRTVGRGRVGHPTSVSKGDLMMQSVNHSGSRAGASAFAEDGSFNSSSIRFSARLTKDSEGGVLTLEGELDLETAPEFDRQLDRIHTTEVTRVLIDLSGVTFMDSTGLSSIVRASRFAESNGHSLVLRRGPRQVQRLFELTGIESRLTFEGP